MSIYFIDGKYKGRKRRDLTLAFKHDDELYKKCKHLGSSRIKEIIGIVSYKSLLEQAEAEDRTPSNYIKHKLRSSL